MLYPYYITANVPPYIQSVFNARGGSLYASARVISMSQHLLDEIFEKTNIKFRTPACDYPRLGRSHLRPAARPYLQGNVARFVTAGRVAEEKGIGLIVEASSILRQEGVTNFSIDVYGEGNVAFYVAMANNLGVGDMIRFAGPRSQRELMDSYARGPCFPFPHVGKRAVWTGAGGGRGLRRAAHIDAELRGFRALRRSGSLLESRAVLGGFRPRDGGRREQ